jgi:hypothetical protein
MEEPHSRIYYVGQDIDDDTKLWRYTRLSSLLMLLIGKLFIPTIDTLRRDDPAEATALCRPTKKRFLELTREDRECLQDCATSEELRYIDANKDSATQIFEKIWLREIGKRRCAWCWYAADIESMAQWHVYAEDGVAICSTPKRIRRALKEHVVDSGLIGAVRYDCDIRDDSTFLRPYLVKRKYYEHEKEVRLVLPAEPRDQMIGLLLPIDARELISEIRISPLLPHGEALGLRLALERFVNYAEGNRLEDLDLITIGISDVKDISTTVWERFKFFEAQKTDIANFGKLKMPFILSDDIKRGLASSD